MRGVIIVRGMSGEGVSYEGVRVCHYIMSGDGVSYEGVRGVKLCHMRE